MIMIDNIKLSNYKSFFADQIKEAINEQQKINKSQMCNLFKTGELSLAYVEIGRASCRERVYVLV